MRKQLTKMFRTLVFCMRIETMHEDNAREAGKDEDEIGSTIYTPYKPEDRGSGGKGQKGSGKDKPA